MFWGDICREVIAEITKLIILLYSALVSPQLYYCVWFVHHRCLWFLHHTLQRCRQTRNGTEEINRNERFNLHDFPRCHLALHFYEIIFEAVICCMLNVLRILYFCSFPVFPKITRLSEPVCQFVHCNCLKHEHDLAEVCFNTDFTETRIWLEIFIKM